jgi:basic membrane protein A
MVAIAASTLKDAIPVASEAVCKGTVWYVAGGQGVVQTKYFAQTNDIESQSGYASGVAAGLIMKAKGATKAGFITGISAPFTINFAKAWEIGIKTQVPTAKIVSTYTGDFDKSDLAVEAYSAMKAQGVGIVYPYLGGATDAVALQAAKDGIPVLTPGTDRCASTSPPFAISVIFSPGDYFAGAVEHFAAGTLRVGTALTFHLGVDPAPTVKICKPTGDQAAVLARYIKEIGTGQINTGTVTGLDDYNGYVPKA